MPRSLFIVARQLPQVYAHLRAQFGHEPDVEVLVDRRRGDRRRQSREEADAVVDRRRGERRNTAMAEQLRAVGYVFVRVS